MEAATRQDAVVLFQCSGDLTVVPTQKIHRDDTYAVFGAFGTGEPDMRAAVQCVQESGGKGNLMGTEGIKSHGADKGQRGTKTENARKIGGTGLEAVGESVRHLRRIGGAACSAGNQGRQLTGKAGGQGDAADSLRTHQSLVPRETDSIRPQGPG